MYRGRDDSQLCSLWIICHRVVHRYRCFFYLADCRKADDERKKKKSIKCYVIFSVIVLIPSLPFYLLAGNERPLSCAPNLRCITNNDSGCDAVERVRFGILIVLGFFLTLLTAFTACCKLDLMFLRERKAKE